MLDIVYENVTSAPSETIVDLYRAGGWWQEEPAWRAAIPQMIRGSLCFLLAREPGGRVVGMGRVISDGASDGYIQDVVVLPEFRGRGIGRTIIRRLTDRCVAAGLTWIGLVAEPGTQKFYQALDTSPSLAFNPCSTRCVPDRDAFLGFPFAPIENRAPRARDRTFLPATRNPCLTTVRLRWASGRRFSITLRPRRTGYALALRSGRPRSPAQATATIGTGFRDLAGNPTPPAPSNCPHRWSSNRSAPSSWRDIRLLPRTSTWSRIATVPTTCTAPKTWRRWPAVATPRSATWSSRPRGSTPGGSSRSARSTARNVSKSATTSQPNARRLPCSRKARRSRPAIRDFAALGLRGLLLRIDDRPAAFSIYDRLNPTTALVLFERALRDKKGLYQGDQPGNRPRHSRPRG